MFNDDKGNFVSLISDGMGTGGRAAVDSMMTVNLMEKLVKSGLSFDCALGLTNSALMVKVKKKAWLQLMFLQSIYLQAERNS